MEIFTIAFSTFLGAAVALVAARLTRGYDARLQEEAAINNLIMDLAAKRAFLVGESWVWADGELQRVVDSVFHARTLIRDARLSTTPRSRALGHLRTMGQACNIFLEHFEHEPDGALDALKDLTVTVSGEVQALHALRPRRILDDEPGSGALL